MTIHTKHCRIGSDHEHDMGIGQCNDQIKVSDGMAAMTTRERVGDCAKGLDEKMEQMKEMNSPNTHNAKQWHLH